MPSTRRLRVSGLLVGALLSLAASCARPAAHCLPAGTRIATPAGPVLVQRIRVGDTILTRDANGAAIPTRVLRVSAVAVGGAHQLLHLSLSDGRQVHASPGHPTDDGRELDALRQGDPIDGTFVLARELVPYGGRRTFDLLPDGPTGVYQANGVWLGSSLSPRTEDPSRAGR